MGIYNISSEKTKSLATDLREARNDHIDWLNQFNKHLICGVSTYSEIKCHKECTFGKFYYSVKEEVLLNNDFFIKIEKTHKNLHDMANKLVAKYEDNQVISVESYDSFIKMESEFTQQEAVIYSYIQETHHSMDKLTTLPNKGLMLSFLEKEHAKLERLNIESSLVFADIDYFKRINDKYGHVFGDKVLQEISNSLLVGLREYDVVSRFGGEEFLIFLFDTPVKSARKIIERTRQRISRIVINSEDNEPLHVTCSFGISAFTKNYSLEENIKKSDIALYSAKEKGRNRVEEINGCL